MINLFFILVNVELYDEANIDSLLINHSFLWSLLRNTNDSSKLNPRWYNLLMNWSNLSDLLWRMQRLTREIHDKCKWIVNGTTIKKLIKPIMKVSTIDLWSDWINCTTINPYPNIIDMNAWMWNNLINIVKMWQIVHNFYSSN